MKQPNHKMIVAFLGVIDFATTFGLNTFAIMPRSRWDMLGP